MSWIGYSLLMFLSSVALYLVVRKSSLVKVPQKTINLAMFGIPLLAFLVIGIFEEGSYSVSMGQLISIALIALLFAYGGNKASLKAIGIAPNPGYSLVLSKSYVLFTTIVAVLFMNGDISVRSVIAILLIVVASALIMVNPKTAEHVKDNKWVVLSFVSFFSWGMLSLTSKYLFNHGLATTSFLIFLYLFVTLTIIVYDKVKLSEFKKIGKQMTLLLLATGVFSTLFNLGQFQAIRLAPNVGYVNAITAASISLVTILAVIFFKDELTLRKAIGVFGVTVGLVLLLI